MRLHLTRVLGFGAGGGPEQRNAGAHARDFFRRQLSLRLDRAEQHLFDGASGLSGRDEPHGGPDAAKVVGAAVRAGEGFLCVRADQLRNGGFDLVDAAIKLGHKTLANRCKALSKQITHDNFPLAQVTATRGTVARRTLKSFGVIYEQQYSVPKK
jgi:hypothetical protein